MADRARSAWRTRPPRSAVGHAFEALRDETEVQGHAQPADAVDVDLEIAGDPARAGIDVGERDPSTPIVDTVAAFGGSTTSSSGTVPIGEWVVPDQVPESSPSGSTVSGRLGIDAASATYSNG